MKFLGIIFILIIVQIFLKWSGIVFSVHLRPGSYYHSEYALPSLPI
jgi:hypothetical protein